LIEFTIKAQNVSLSNEAEISLFRVAQECVNNSIKHAQATTIKIELTQGSRELETQLLVKDNGIGISIDRLENPDRFGIRGMKERMQALGGELTIQTSSKAGTVVTASLPFASAKIG
jgi:signal transduction histidine kinase